MKKLLKLLKSIHTHSWKYGATKNKTTRECTKCGKKQWLDSQSLGIHPPYLYIWVNIDEFSELGK